MKLHGFYILKDEYFELVDDCYLKNNKDGNRPFYYCFKDNNSEKEIYWMIPLSSRIEKYNKLIENKKTNNKPCDGLYICKLPNDKESGFLIQDIFPIAQRPLTSQIKRERHHCRCILSTPYENSAIGWHFSPCAHRHSENRTRHENNCESEKSFPRDDDRREPRTPSGWNGERESVHHILECVLSVFPSSSCLL